MNTNEFYESLTDSERSFKAAISNEERHGFEFEDTMERKYEEGFIDGMRHAYMLLTGGVPDGAPSGSIERATRAAVKGEECQHDNYSESPFVCSQHGEDAECWEMLCDNCNQVQLHETGEDGQTPKAGRVITL